jgi:hypothetical protein
MTRKLEPHWHPEDCGPGLQTFNVTRTKELVGKGIVRGESQTEEWSYPLFPNSALFFGSPKVSPNASSMEHRARVW